MTDPRLDVMWEAMKAAGMVTEPPPITAAQAKLLREEILRLRKALKPFAVVGKALGGRPKWGTPQGPSIRVYFDGETKCFIPALPTDDDFRNVYTACGG